MTDQSAVFGEGLSSGQASLVTVNFQRSARQKEKYLDAEPKALGITQIGLSVYQILWVGVQWSKGLNKVGMEIPFFISSAVVLIAGGVAIGAQKLHLPTLKACLGMQIGACIASVYNFICMVLKMERGPYCWSNYDYESTNDSICRIAVNTHNNIYAVGLLIEVALLAISATLAAYCCKVVNCCAPASKMPVITVHAPPEQQETNANDK